MDTDRTVDPGCADGRPPRTGPAPRLRLESLHGLPVPGAGLRVLLERSLPVRLAVGTGRPGLWLPALAPSGALRRWYAEHREEFEPFAERYGEELDRPDRAAQWERLRAAAADRSLILQVAGRNPARSHAAVLARRLDAAPNGPR
ncbi:DUF488 domain-containing protein [Kitasatospora sp. NPDC058965]|uniref:DUF488 domain-containing protein n=1 Tax=Kitasatospora sp. NPDC058965 TaxID=3346682 RepID=UPI003683FFAE